MEHALQPSGPSGHSHPWRTIAVVATGIAMLELVGLLIVAIALLAKPVLHHAQKEARAAAAKPAVVKKPVAARIGPLLPRRRVSVTVLNGNGVSGAAAAEASRVRARGYIVGVVGNAPHGSYGQTVVMYRAARRGEALRLARDLQIRRVSPLDGLRRRDLHAAKLAIIVGA